MIHTFSVKNFLSIKDEVTFSFEAKKRDNHLKDVHVVDVAEGVSLLKLAIVYGKNASGKTNLINAFGFLRNFWFKVTEDKDEKIELTPFLLDKDSRNKPSDFSLVFYKNGVKYKYVLSVYKNTVVYEKLEFYPTTQPAVIFERKDDGGVSVITFGAKIKIKEVASAEIVVKCLPNISFFAAYNQVNSKVKEIDEAVNWMKKQFMPPITPLSTLRNFTENLIYENDECKINALNYLQKADFNIFAINTEEHEQELTDDMIVQLRSMGFPDSGISKLEKERKIKVRNTEFKHSVLIDEKPEYFSLNIEEQSDGTKRMFGLSGPIYKAIKENAFVAIDEIEAKLHPRLVEYVLDNFLKESDQAQMLVATHYDNLFDEEDLFRKDNFWFTDKRDNGSTDLYPLHKFNGLNRISSLQKAYKYGKFGAIPEID